MPDEIILVSQWFEIFDEYETRADTMDRYKLY